MKFLKIILSEILKSKKLLNNYIETQDLGDRTVKVQKIASQFDTIKFKSSKKMTDNKMKFVLQLNSNHDETNIITQVLDLILTSIVVK